MRVRDPYPHKVLLVALGRFVGLVALVEVVTEVRLDEGRVDTGHGGRITGLHRLGAGARLGSLRRAGFRLTSSRLRGLLLRGLGLGLRLGLLGVRVILGCPGLRRRLGVRDHVGRLGARSRSRLLGRLAVGTGRPISRLIGVPGIGIIQDRADGGRLRRGLPGIGVLVRRLAQVLKLGIDRLRLRGGEQVAGLGERLGVVRRVVLLGLVRGRAGVVEVVLVVELLLDVLDDGSGQLGVPLGGVRLTVLVECHRPSEPVGGRLLVPGLGQRVGVGEREPRRPRPGLRVAQLGQALERDDRGVVLAEVPAGAGLHDAQLDLPGPVEAFGLGRTYEVERPLGPTHPAFAVGHDRQVRLRTGHPSRGAQIAQRLREVPGTVGDDAGGLPYDTDAGRETAGHLGVFVSLVRVVRLERPLGGDEVPAHQLGQVARQGTQLLAYFLLELVGGDVGLDLGQPLALRSAGLVLRPAEPRPGAARPLVTRERPRTVVPVSTASGASVVTVAERTALAAIARAPVTATVAARPTIVAEPALATRTPVIPVPERTTLAGITARAAVIAVTEGATLAAVATRATVVTVAERTALAGVTRTPVTTAVATRPTIVTVSALAARTPVIAIPERATLAAVATRTPVIPVTERATLATVTARATVIAVAERTALAAIARTPVTTAVGTRPTVIAEPALTTRTPVIPLVSTLATGTTVIAIPEGTTLATVAPRTPVIPIAERATLTAVTARATVIAVTVRTALAGVTRTPVTTTVATRPTIVAEPALTPRTPVIPIPERTTLTTVTARPTVIPVTEGATLTTVAPRTAIVTVAVGPTLAGVTRTSVTTAVATRPTIIAEPALTPRTPVVALPERAAGAAVVPRPAVARVAVLVGPPVLTARSPAAVVTTAATVIPVVPAIRPRSIGIGAERTVAPGVTFAGTLPAAPVASV